MRNDRFFIFLVKRLFLLNSSSLEPFLVLTRVHPGNDLFQLSLGLALREVVHVVVLRRSLDQPLRLDVSHGPDVILRSQDELVVQDPLRFVIQTGGRVKLDDLVILDGQVVAGSLQMGDLQ